MDGKTKKKSVEKRGTRKKKDLVINSVGVGTSEPKKKATKKEKVTTTKKAKQQKGQPAPTFEQVQLRAYFISEQRRSFGLPGNEHSDWVRAEKELREELLAEGAK
ncbi:MAG TPA: DUF2934 domain-containing protein [Chthoniobacterales bacterium]|nr:DUF2934 domain-containing protein [Chthoniobacterales bacterium]